MLHNNSKYRIITSANATRLTIANVSQNDSGSYVCGTIVRDIVSSSVITLNVSGACIVIGRYYVLY